MTTDMVCDPSRRHIEDLYYNVILVYAVVTMPWLVVWALYFMHVQFWSVMNIQRNPNQAFCGALGPMRLMVTYIFLQNVVAFLT